MPKLKRLTTKQVLAILSPGMVCMPETCREQVRRMQFGFVIVSQRGSHIKLGRIVYNQKQTLTIPNHAELDTGTCKAIMRQASRYISSDELYPHFYTE